MNQQGSYFSTLTLPLVIIRGRSDWSVGSKCHVSHRSDYDQQLKLCAVSRLEQKDAESLLCQDHTGVPLWQRRETAQDQTAVFNQSFTSVLAKFVKLWQQLTHFSSVFLISSTRHSGNSLITSMASQTDKPHQWQMVAASAAANTEEVRS